MYTIAGAPNVLLGGSHSGNLGAAEAIQYQSIDILCSDYYPAAMLHSIFGWLKSGMDLAD
jgi:alpha-D-ribose 1-methylphosphonate 5-triphosphate diphosphatase